VVPLSQRGTAFGSRVESDLPLPLGRSHGKAPSGSLWIRCGQPERLYPSDRRLTRIGASSEVRGVVSPRRRTIWVERTGRYPGAVWGTVMGLSLPHLLSARGSVVLHASCAIKDGIAVAFVGRQRAGKSSIAAGLVTAGWRLVADDSLVVTAAGGRIRVAPSFPALRLWTPLAASLTSALGLEQAPIHPAIDKQWVFLGERYWSDKTRVDLACLCILDEGAPSRLHGPETMLAVLAATYDPEPELPRHWSRWFDSARQLACSVPVLRLSVPGQFGTDFRFVTGVTRQLRAAGVL
jgi:hypothetical protein